MLLVSPNPSLNEPAANTATQRTSSTLSQRSNLASTAHRPLGPQSLGEPHHERPVERDGDQQRRAVDGPLPEGRHAEDRQRARDRGQQQRAERRPDHGPAAAEDRHAADDDRGHHGQFPAVADGRVDGAEVGGVHDPAQPDQRAGDHERAEYPPPGRDAREPRGVGVRADRVQFPAGTEVVQPVCGDGQHDQRDERQVGHPEHRAGTERQEPGRHLVGVDLRGVGARRPRVVDAAEHVQRPERDHQRRHLRDGDERAVDGPAHRAERDAGEHHHDDRKILVDEEELPGQVGGQAHDRPDRQVDVAGDHEQRLPDREQRDDRGVQEQVVDPLPGQEGRPRDRRGGHHRDERDDDAQLASGERRLPGGGSGHAAPPVAAWRTFPSVASSLASSAVSRPSCMTSTRSAIPSTSDSSDEIISTAMPRAARSDSSACTSTFAPMSMPRVGSSTISTTGSVASHLPSTTFCWLPPDSVATASVTRRRFTPSLSVHADATARSRDRRTRPHRATAPSWGSVALRSIDRSRISPCSRRSSGTIATPASIAARGSPPDNRLPPTVTVPASSVSTPKIARATSDRPDPTSPAFFSIAPRPTENDTSANTPSRRSPVTTSASSPASWSRAGYSCSTDRPTMLRTSSSRVIEPIGDEVTNDPSRSTVTRWQISYISSSRCEMNSSAAPFSTSRATTRNSRCASTVDSAAVGSSITMIRASAVSALPISMICWSAIDSPRVTRPGSMGTPSESKSSAARLFIAARSMRRKDRSGWRPMNTFSATVRSGNCVGSWWITAMPACCASRGPAKCTGSPSTSTSPASGRCSPPMTRTTVDLPAPFSPARPWTSPARSSSDTPRSACTAAKDLWTSRSSSSGGVNAVTSSPPARL